LICTLETLLLNLGQITSFHDVYDLLLSIYRDSALNKTTAAAYKSFLTFYENLSNTWCQIICAVDMVSLRALRQSILPLHCFHNHPYPSFCAK
jgi:hypothetical protein